MLVTDFGYGRTSKGHMGRSGPRVVAVWYLKNISILCIASLVRSLELAGGLPCYRIHVSCDTGWYSHCLLSGNQICTADQLVSLYLYL